MAFACVKNNDAEDKLRYYVFLVKPKSDDGSGTDRDKDRHRGLSLRMMATGRAKDTAEWER